VRSALAAGLVLLATTGWAAAPNLFGGGRLVAYTPRGFDPRTGRPPDFASVRSDADQLHRRGFRALATYASTRALAPVCRIFKRRGFRTVLIGVADPTDAAAVHAAVRQRGCADGYFVGDGGLGAGRYTRAALVAAVGRIRAASRRPVTVREELAAYDDALLALGDWAYPIADPYRAGAWHPQDACGYGLRQQAALRARLPRGLPLVLAGMGLPTTGPPAASENYQRALYLCLETRRVPFEYAEAFDQPWRGEGPEAHRGLFRDDGTPKMFAAVLAAPSVTVTRRGSWLRGRVRNVAPEHVRVVIWVHGRGWEPRATGAVSRRGKWKARVPEAADADVQLVAPAYAPLTGMERPPMVDGERVLAAAVERAAAAGGT
jgi:hypothetical protein